MSVRRSRAVKMIEKAANSVIEQLEARRLMTTAIGGEFGTFDPQGHFIPKGGDPTIFEYRERDGDVVRIKLTGDIDAEFIGLRLGKGSDQNGFTDTTKKLVDLQQAFTSQTPDQSTDLFQIYISASAPDASIAIATVPDLTTPVRPMQPFGGTSGAIRIIQATTGQTITTTTGAGTGGVYIGARTLDTIQSTPLEQDIPILSVKRNSAFGLRPAPFNGRIGAGIYTAPGVNTGKLLIGGTVTGGVDIAGSIDTFYAGAILTGDATGQTSINAPVINDNFRIGGDIRALFTTGGIGTTEHVTDNRAQIYSTGFDMEVGGRIGTVYSQSGDIYGSIHARNDTKGWSGPQREVELRDIPFPANSDQTYFEDLAELGTKSYNPDFENDTFQTAQYIGTFNSKSLKTDNVAVVDGFIDTVNGVLDDDDYYGMALMAGQTVTVQLFSRANLDSRSNNLEGASEDLNVGVFDPDGRLVASDYSNSKTTTSNGVKVAGQGDAFTFTADRPGVYRFAVGTNGDVNFTAHTSTNTTEGYQLQIKNAGNIAIGGVVADGSIITDQAKRRFSSTSGVTFADPKTLHAIDADSGDIGGITAGSHDLGPLRLDGTGEINSAIGASFVQMTDVPVVALTGNIRSIEAPDMGYDEGLTLTTSLSGNPRGAPTLYANAGSVGLIRTWDETGLLSLNDSLIDPITGIGKPSKAVGGDYQLIDAAGTFSGTVIADRAIGVIRGNKIGNGKPGSYIVNADNKGNDGVIDLIDSQTDIGDPVNGGPAIVTGPGGNVRYIHVPIDGVAYRDVFFGGGAPEDTKFRPGEVAKLVDDSGTPVTISPSPQQFTSDPANPIANGGVLQIETYPIRGDVNGGSAAGSVIVSVIVDPGPSGVGRGVRVKSSALGSHGTVEIGRITVRSAGTDIALVNTQTTTPGTAGSTAVLTSSITQTPSLTGQVSEILLEGDSTVDLFHAESTAVPPNEDSRVPQPYTGFTSINNDTNGEVVSVEASQLGAISAETIGLSKSNTGGGQNNVAGAASPTTVPQLMNLYPFNQQRNAVFIHGEGNIISARARRGLGNIFVQNGAIGSIAANSNKRNVNGVFEGINAPIVVGFSPNFGSGRIVNVDIGEGIPSQGSGDFGRSGLYAADTIENIVNQGMGSDIRGNVIVGQRSGLVNPDFGEIRNIRLGDGGSIIGANILSTGNWDAGLAFNTGANGLEPTPSDTTTQPYVEIGSIKLTGKGGIMGSRIIGADVGTISTDGGFGFINNFVGSIGSSRINKIVADGYGIRNSVIAAGADIGEITALGDGKLIDVNQFTRSARASAFSTFDPVTGASPNISNDLYLALGLSPSNPKRGFISKSGLITDTTITASRNLTKLSAWAIQDRVVPTLVDPDDADKRIAVDNTNILWPMRMSVGNSIGTITVKDGIYGANISTGTLAQLTTGNDLFQSRLSTSGRMRNIVIGGTVKGNSTIFANGLDGQIENLTITRSLLGNVSASNKIGRINVGRDLGSADFHTSGNIDSLTVSNDILDTAFVESKKQILNLSIGDDLNAGAVVKAKSLGAFHIGGDQAGTLQIG